MVLNFLAMVICIFAVSGLFLMLASDVAELEVSYKRNGALRFFRIGRLSGSFCIRKAS